MSSYKPMVVELQRQLGLEALASRFPGVIKRMCDVADQRPQQTESPVFLPPDLSELSVIKENPAMMIDAKGSIVTDRPLKMFADRYNPEENRVVRLETAQTVQTGYVQSSSLGDARKKTIEITFLTRKENKSMVLGINNPKVIADDQEACMAVAGFVRVKNWVGVPVQLGQADLRFFCAWGGSSNDRANAPQIISNFNALTVGTEVLGINEVRYLPFEFKFDRAMPPTLAVNYTSLAGNSCTHRLRFTLSYHAGADLITLVHSHDVDIPYYSRSLLKYNMYGSVNPATHTFSESNGARTVLALSNGVFHPGDKVKLTAIIWNKPVHSVVVELVEVYGFVGFVPTSARIQCVTLPVKVTPMTVSPVMEADGSVKQELEIVIPHTRDDGNPASRKIGGVNFDGAWGDLIVMHYLRVVTGAIVGYMQPPTVNGILEFPVVVGTCSVNKCLTAGELYSELMWNAINEPGAFGDLVPGRDVLLGDTDQADSGYPDEPPPDFASIDRPN